MKRFIGLFVMIGLLLLLAAPLTAQDTPTPEPVGLRPDAPTYAQHGSYWVGTRDFVIPDAKGDRPLPATIWYPALNPEKATEEVVYQTILGDTLPVFGHALLNAPADLTQGPYPLVIFSHGNGGTRLDTIYYTEHLASYGFVVIAPDHTGNTIVNGGQNQYPYNVLRQLDIIRVIDFAAALSSQGNDLAGLIDTAQVAVTGHSFGAWTALAAAGAQMDLKTYETWCAENPLNDPRGLGFCSTFIDHQPELAALAGLTAVPNGLWPPIHDMRVKAAIALAPGTTAAFGADGLANVSVPVMIMAGTGDSFVPPQYHAFLGYQWLQNDHKALVTFDGADHIMYGTSCDATPWLLPDNFVWCSDPVWDMDRAHDLINHFTTAFLLDVLKGDKDAAAVLAPDQVSFPGISYQAQGF